MIKSNRIYLLLRDIILYTDTRISVLLCSVSYIYWGAIFLLPEITINRPFYTGLEYITSNETFWGILFIILGAVKLFNLIKSSFAKKINISFKIFIYSVKITTCCLSTYILFTSDLSGHYAPVGGDTLAVCLLSWWDFFRFDEISYRKLYLNLIMRKNTNG